MSRIFLNFWGEGEGVRHKAEELFSKEGHTLTIQQQIELLEPVTTKEMRKAIFSIKITKSVGPDGFSSGFYRDAWEIVGRDITSTIMEFMHNGKLPGETNSTVIVVITRVENPICAS